MPIFIDVKEIYDTWDSPVRSEGLDTQAFSAHTHIFLHTTQKPFQAMIAAHWGKVAELIIWRYSCLTWIWGLLGWSGLTAYPSPPSLPPFPLSPSSQAINVEA